AGGRGQCLLQTRPVGGSHLIEGLRRPGGIGDISGQHLEFGIEVGGARLTGKNEGIVGRTERGAPYLVSQTLLKIIDAVVPQSALDERAAESPERRAMIPRQSKPALAQAHFYQDLPDMQLGRLNREKRAIGEPDIGDAEFVDGACGSQRARAAAAVAASGAWSASARLFLTVATPPASGAVPLTKVSGPDPAKMNFIAAFTLSSVRYFTTSS